MRWIAVTLLLLPLTWTVLAQDGPAPPIPSPGEQIQIIEKARDFAREYRDKLPDFIATQTVRRQTLPKGEKSWKAEDTLTIEVTFVEGKEQFNLLTINGKPAGKTKAQRDDLQVSGEFGTNLWAIFAPQSEAKFKWERWTDLRGRSAHVFSHRIEKDRSQFGYDLHDGRRGWKGSYAVNGMV